MKPQSKTFSIFLLILFSSAFSITDLLRPMRAEAQWFQQPSVWTSPIPLNPVIRPNSDNYRDDFKLNNPNSFGVSRTGSSPTVWKAQPTDPNIVVTIKTTNLTIKNNILSRGWNLVPIPAAAVPPGQSDAHVIIYNDDYVWEMYRAVKTDNITWSAVSMRKWDRKGKGVIQTYDMSGAIHNCATSSKLLGTIMKAEIDNGQINHALLYTYHAEKKVQGGALREYPCRVRTEGTSTRQWAHSTGFLFQLDPTINVDALTVPPVAKVVLKAMQRYGIIFTDNTSPGSQGVQAESDTGKSWSWGNTFSNFGWGNLILDNLRLISCHSADCPGSVPTLSVPLPPSNLLLFH
jgi:hypothetical protein